MPTSSLDVNSHQWPSFFGVSSYGKPVKMTNKRTLMLTGQVGVFAAVLVGIEAILRQYDE